jgi:hypothetical protein
MTENARLTARQLAGIPNFWPLESSPEGVEYCWSAENPDILLSFTLDRHETLEMEIKLQALIRSEFLKDLQLLVDDQRLRYSVSASGALTVIRCRLPARDATGATRLKIKLPGAHSPEELGTGDDSRKLGIAISEIRVFSSIGMGARLARWLLRTLPPRPRRVFLPSVPKLNEVTTPGLQSIRAMNSHITIGNLLHEIDEEVNQQKCRSTSG